VKAQRRAPRSRKSLVGFGAAAVLAMTAATAQVVAEAQTSGSPQQQLQACMVASAQDREACQREIRNAQADQRRGGLVVPGADFQANAAARCAPLGGEDKAACQARVMGYGETSGSVAGGGVLRSVETVVMPPGQSEITVEPKTAEPVVIVPAR
jgi:hypothetical protein